MTRKVKTISAALARTSKPVTLGDGLENVVAGLGTDRDKMSYSTYGLPRPLSRMELENMYRCSWLAKKIVNAIADDMTREWRHVSFDDKENDAQFAIEQAEKQIGLKEKTNSALRWARLYGGAVMIIGTKDKDLSKPLNIEAIRKDDLRYLHVMDRWRVSASGTLCDDLSSPNFGMPEYYILADSSLRVHYSRVLRFNGQKLPYFAWKANALWDDSELQHILDSLTHCDTATKGVATMLFEANVDVVKTENLSDLLATKNGEAVITKRFQLAAMLKSFNRMLLLDGSESYEKKSNSFSNLDKILLGFMTDVSGAADIPMTRLFGQSPGGLNATGDNDVRNYYDMVSAKQEAELRPQLEYLDEILVRSALGIMPDDYKFDFKSLWQISDTEKSTIEKTRAERDQIYVDLGVVTEGVIAKDLKEAGTYHSLTDEDVEMAEELSKSMSNEVADPAEAQAETDPKGMKQ